VMKAPPKTANKSASAKRSAAKKTPPTTAQAVPQTATD
jgi:hypothetical protein